MKKSKRKTGLTFKPVISRYGDYITKELKYPEIKNSGVEEKLEIEKRVYGTKLLTNKNMKG